MTIINHINNNYDNVKTNNLGITFERGEDKYFMFNDSKRVYSMHDDGEIFGLGHICKTAKALDKWVSLHN